MKEYPWLESGDGFAMCRVPLAEMLHSAGFDDTGLSEANPRDVDSYYDDWHLFSVTEEQTVYSLLKMREQEYDYVPGFADGDDPGVTISFIALNIEPLEAVLSGDGSRMAEFVDTFRTVTEYRHQHHDDVLQRYFSRPEAKAPYLVAEEYLAKLMHLCTNGTLPLPNMMAVASDRVTKELGMLNDRAGRIICDCQEKCLRIADPEHPTEEERSAVLAAYTGNLSLNSFAAEVKFHSDALVHVFRNIPVLGEKKWYASAIRADLGIEGEKWFRTRFFSPYYHDNSALVQEQIRIHGRK